MTTKSPWRPDFGPRDVVRVIIVHGLKPDSRLQKGNIYTVDSIDPCTTSCPTMGPMETIVRLREDATNYSAFRFELIAKAHPEPAADPTPARMALVMRKTERETGACTIDDLARAGFTTAQILEYADEARGLAGAPSGMEAA